MLHSMETHPNSGIKIETNEHYTGNFIGLPPGSIVPPIPGVQPSLPPLGLQTQSVPSPGSTGTYRSLSSKQRWNESPEARARRLARNAERMRERRARESEDEYRARLARNAEANRMRRQNESEVERAMRLVRNAARQRLRRAMETPEQRAKRLAKLAERMRLYRANETPDQRKERLAEMAARARERIARETSEERKERLRKLSEYAKRVRSTKNSIKKQHQEQQNISNDNNLQSPNAANHQQLQQDNQQQAQHTQNELQNHYVPSQTLTNSIEYYQNMFISSALRPNLNKELQQQLQNSNQQHQQTQQHQHQSQQQNHQQESIASSPKFPQNLVNMQIDPSFFQQTSPVPKYQPPYQTLTSSIEYYQNKYINKEKIQSQLQQQHSQQESHTNPSDSSEQKETDEKIKKSEPSSLSNTPPNFPSSSAHQIQNPPNPLYNQFPYLNNFPAAAATAVQSSSVPNQQNYYPMYHNGFQLAITPNSVPPPFTPVHFQNAGPATTIAGQSPNPYSLLNSTSAVAAVAAAAVAQNQSQAVQDFPKTVRGRSKKIFSDNDITRLPAELQEEALRQQKVHALLENEINQMLAAKQLGISPSRGRPGRGQETEEERRIRLRKMADHQRKVRANESAEARAARLKSLSERARLKRKQVRETETEDERKDRLSKQAEYARLRRIRAQNPDAKKRMEERAKQLYAQIHSASQSGGSSDTNQSNPQRQQHNHQQHHMATTAGTSAMVASNANNGEEFVKNPQKDFAQSENNDVLKILEPIIVMKSK